MTYTEFENTLFARIAEAEAGSPRGQVEVRAIVETLPDEIPERWIDDAINSFEARGWLGVRKDLISPPRTVVTLSGGGRQAAAAKQPG